MSDPNPYEPPQIESRPATGRRLAVGAVLGVLSIPAAGIAGFGTCTASAFAITDGLMVLPTTLGLLVALSCYLLAAWCLEGMPRLSRAWFSSRRFWLCFWTLAVATPGAMVVGGALVVIMIVIQIENGPRFTIPNWMFVVIGTGTYAACLTALHLARKWKPDGKNKP
jgi:hypothetical protein